MFSGSVKLPFQPLFRRARSPCGEYSLRRSCFRLLRASSSAGCTFFADMNSRKASTNGLISGEMRIPLLVWPGCQDITSSRSWPRSSIIASRKTFAKSLYPHCIASAAYGNNASPLGSICDSCRRTVFKVRPMRRPNAVWLMPRRKRS